MTRATEGQTLKLPPTLGLNEAVILHGQLLALRGTPLTIDGTDVQRCGTQPIQVLLSAARTWASDDQDIEFTLSDALQKTINLIGIEMGHLNSKEKQ